MAPHKTGNPTIVPIAPIASITKKDKEAIAVIGYSFTFPQDAATSDEFWRILVEKRSTATLIPKERMNVDSMYHPDVQRRGTFPVKRGHFIKGDLAGFDAPFFATSKTDASSMDPQQRYLLESTYKALENAGLPLENVFGTKTSVYSGSFSTDWQQLQCKDPDEFQTTTALGVQPCFNANRVSWFFNFTGNSANIDTACSSSLVGLDMSLQGLQSGEADMGIVTGSNMIMSPDNMHSLTNLNMLSPDGECYSFDHRANGYSRGEGVGVLVLKRVSDAIRHGDTIRGIIRSTGCNQDGHTSSITLPSAIMQETLIRETYQKAGLSMKPTRFFEAHGTGTAVGDPNESKALGSAFRKFRSSRDPLWVGAVKSNIGHLEGASGIAGVIKALLVLEKGVIPPNNNFEKVNPMIDTDFLNIRFPRESMPWPVKGLRRASVNSFGNAGTNSHVILDDVYHFLRENGLSANHVTVEYPELETGDSLHSKIPLDTEISDAEISETPKLLFLSSNDDAGVQRQAKAYSEYFSKIDSVNAAYLDNLSYTLSVRRTSFDWKSYAVVNSVNDLQNIDSIMSPATKSIENPAVGLIFTGQGAQWAGMGKELMKLPVFRNSLRRSEETLLSIGCQWLLCEEILEKDGTRINSPEIAQPGCTALQIALLELLYYLGVTPTVVVGHSSGEIGAAYATGAISAESALRLAYYRGLLSTNITESTSGVKGGMISVGLSEETVKPFIENITTEFGVSGLTVACINSPKNVTLSGDLDQVDAIKNVLDKKGIFARKLLVSNAYHSPHMLAAADAYREAIQNLKPGLATPKPVAMVSSVTGMRVEAADLINPEYWMSNMVSPVRFLDAIETILSVSSQRFRRKLDLSHRKYFKIDILVEVGPHSALQGPLNDTLLRRAGSKVKYVSMLLRNENAIITAFKAFGFLKCLGYPVDLLKINKLKPHFAEHYVSLATLPEYIFDHSQRYWDESKLCAQYRLGGQAKLALLGRPVNDWNPLEPRWRNFLRVSEMPWIEDHSVNGVLIYPGAGMLAMAIEAAAQLTVEAEDILGFDITEVFFRKPLKISSDAMGVDTNLVIHLPPASKRPLNNKAEFRVFSYQDDGWQENCYGLIQARYREVHNEVECRDSQHERLNSFRQTSLSMKESCTTSLEPGKFYSATQESGLGLGPSFHLVTKGSFNEGRVSGTIQPFIWPNDQFPEAHVIHPTTLDAILHMGFAAMTKGGDVTTSTMIPTFIRSIFVSKNGLSCFDTSEIRHNAWLQEKPRGADVSGFALNVAEDSLLVHFEDMRLTTVAENIDVVSARGSDTPQPAYRIEYKPDPDFLDSEKLNILYKGCQNYQSSLEHYLDLLAHKNGGLHILEIEPENLERTARLIRTLSIFDKYTSKIVHRKYSSFCLGTRDGELVNGDKQEFPSDEITTVAPLDIGRDPGEQGVDGPFDVILAPHAVQFSEDALLNIKKIISPYGKLVLLDKIDQDYHVTEQPRSTITECGFASANLSLALPTVAQIYTNVGNSELTSTAKNLFFVLDSDSALQKQTFHTLAALWKYTSSENVSSGSLQDALALNNAEKTIFIVLFELDHPFIHSLEEHAFQLVRQLLQTSRDVLWVTSDGESVPGNPEYAIIQGLTRVLRNEYSYLNITVATLKIRERISEPQEKHLTQLFVDRHLDPKPWILDTEFREIEDCLQIARVAQDTQLSHDLYKRAKPQASCRALIRDLPPLSLACQSFGNIDTLHFAEDKTSSLPLTNHEVEIQTQAIGVSNRDNLIVQGKEQDVPLGLECAGIVTRVGTDTTFQPGDRVMLAASGSFKTLVRGEIAVRIPENISLSTAAAIPADFGSAWAILHRIAGLEEGESVLIHSAANGTGQAAIQIAQLLGAQIFATVASTEEKALLMDNYSLPEEHIFYSRGHGFVTGVLGITNGHGVDVIINSLADDGFVASWKCIASHGRFIETGIQSNASNGLIPSFGIKKNVTFIVFNVHHTVTERPAVFRRDLEKVMGLFAQRKLHSNPNIRTCDISKVKDVFEKVQKGNDSDKHVLSVSSESEVQAIIDNRPSFRMKNYETFVIAGGLGGIGRASARWMAARGARNLVLLSRLGPRNESGIQLIEELKTMGVRVETPACDITDIHAMRVVFEKLTAGMPPIKGVIQASIVARDCLFDDLKFPDWKVAMECKTVGSWNLHTVLPKGMDFFILLASASGLAGIKGQANYNAGNVYEDAMARYRVSIGEKAVSFDLGAMADDGILAEDKELLSRVHGYGTLDVIRRETYHGLLDYYCNPELPILAPDEAQIAFGLGTGGGDALESLDYSRQPILQPLFLEGERKTAKTAAGNETGAKSRDQFAASESLENAANIFAEAAIEKLGKSLAVMQDGASVDHHKPLQGYGVDSLLAIELRNWIFKDFNADVAVFEVQGSSTLGTLSMLVAGRSTIQHEKWSIME
ncbi:polyketide synthase [Penicillium angulare]|uniref:polyketide synthase n=1 Tax=Penicillium angulare TaxID=116970 RepID=UPI002540DF3F|nr:polyketide synthase [Penicillium angulare]KAJ5291696.1 polyketide synthase [Penicillium angulare]